MIIETYNIKENSTLKDVYKEIANYLFTKNKITNKNLFIKELEERELLGDIRIYKDVYLPHIISSNFSENIVLRTDGLNEKILFILIKKDDECIKYKITRLINKMLDKDFVYNLFNCNNKEFIKILELI